jgi:hypothetical protein
MPASVNQRKKEKKSMDRPAEPIHGCSIRPFAPPLIGTTLH